jgi:hypothetical protein
MNSISKALLKRLLLKEIVVSDSETTRELKFPSYY